MKTLKYFILAALVTVLWVGCEKEESSSDMTRVKVRMTDAPGNFQEVNVDVKGVEFVTDKGTVSLNVTAGVYNLLDFVNGLDTLIASAEVESGTLSQVRLILGSNNTVKVDNMVFPLSTPSAQQSGLKMNVNATLIPGVDYELLLDFDANQSVVKTGNGVYQLKPVVRAISEATTGAVHGHIATALALPAVISVTNGTLTYTSVTDANGNFMVRGLAAGTYTVTITPTLPTLPVTIANVSVKVGVVTELTALGI